MIYLIIGIIFRERRLYPAYIVTIILCLILKHFYISPGNEYISPWGGDFWRWNELTTMQLINVLSLIGRFDTKLLDPPTWSLVVEMRMAFFLPLLIIMAYKFEKYNVYIFALLLILSFVKILASIFNFAYLFYLGIILARKLPKICVYVNSQSKRWICGILLIGALLYESRFPFRMLLFGTNVYTYYQENIFHIMTGLGSAVIICMFFYKSIQNALSYRIGSFLGYISYSVYLIHFPILLGLCQLKINLWYIFPVFMSLSILGAYAMYRFIELPGIKLGRYLSDKH